MKIEVIKLAGGLLTPASDIEVEKLTKFKTGEQYQVEIKLTRNPAFHRKVFQFMSFCYQYWRGSNEFISEAKQFDVFRKNLTVLAGFYDSAYAINSSVIITAKSLSFSNMNQSDFEECYNALINAALTHIFTNANADIENKLKSFF